MPPYKKKRKHLHTKKQLKVTESRLMEISLKIENYIYKNKPISLQDAAHYIQEVSSYKFKYGKNPRIYQVAEKLIRQLKGVIEEQDLSYSWNVQDVIGNSIPVSIPSPTYSELEIDIAVENDPLCDDNELVGMESRKRENENSAVASDLSMMEPTVTKITATESYEKYTNIRKDDKLETVETINLTVADNVVESNTIVTKAQIDDNNSPIKGIQKSLSQLEINNNEEKQKTINLRSVRKVSQGTKHYNQTLDILRMPQINSPYGRNYHPPDMIDTTEVIEINNDTNSTQVTTTNETIFKSQHIENTIPQNPPKKRGRKKAVAKLKKRNDGDDPKEKPKQRRRTKTLKTKNNEIVFTNTERPKDNIFTKAVVPSNVHSSPIKTVYNKNVENDLSWVENIRFIREVAPDEIDPKLKYYDESFWDTFDLPANWNDQDFLY